MQKFINLFLVIALLLQPLSAYAYGPHQLTSIVDPSGQVVTKFDYDLNGNMITKNEISKAKMTTYEYDSFNRLKAVRINGLLSEEYAYDGNDGRTKKVTYKDGNTIESTVVFVGNLEEVINDVNGKTIMTHVYIPSGARVASITSGEVAYYHNDHLGSSSIMTNANGELIEQTENDPYGKLLYTNKFTSTKNAKQFYFNGKYLDSKIGLYYYGARYYDSQIARFITPDTIIQDYGDSQAYNRYAYVRNNPVNAIDPSGHFFHLIFMGIAMAIKGIIATSIAHPIIMGGALAGAASEIHSMSQGQNFGQAYMGAIVPTLTGAAMGGIGALNPSLGIVQWALTGGAVGGLGSIAQGGSFGSGFLGGAIGGAAMWAGGSIMMQKFAMAGLLGNIVSSGGMSAIENSMMARPWNESYRIYLGPLSVSLEKGCKPAFGLSSLSNLFYLGKGIFGPSKFDFWNTLSSGTPVFSGAPFVRGAGATKGNVIFLGGSQYEGHSASGKWQYPLGHERVHAHLQGRLGAGIPGVTDLITQSALSNSTFIDGGGGKQQSADMGWARENPFEIQASTFSLWGE